MYLALAERSEELEMPHIQDIWGPIVWCWYQLIRQRADKFWLDSLMLAACSISVLVSSLAPAQDLSFTRLVVLRVCTAILAFLAGRWYAPVFVKRVFMERQ
jgi:hypothetical protein